jgi:hypothetical protein
MKNHKESRHRPFSSGQRIQLRLQLAAAQKLLPHSLSLPIIRRHLIAGQDNHRDPDGWTKLIKSSVCRMARAGLHSRDQTTTTTTTAATLRFVLLVCEISDLAIFSRFRDYYYYSNLYGDLNCLIREDNPDLDFFLNITHVRLRRRSRAFQRLRKRLNDINEPVSEPSEPTRSFSPQSLSTQCCSQLVS